MKNIIVRNVNETDLKAIDYKVQKLKESDPQGHWARNKYVRMLIQNDTRKELENYEKTQYELLLKRDIDLRQETLNALNRILYLMTNGELPEAMNIVDKLANDDKNIPFNDYQN